MLLYLLYYTLIISNYGSEKYIICFLYIALSDCFYGIDGFEYERGFSYELSIEKTTLANPPADAGNIRYKLLEVLVRKSHFHAVESRYAIDADQKDMIEADLHNNLPVPVNGGYIINNSTVSIVDENKTVIKSGNLTTNPPEGEVFPNSYKLITPEKQIITQSGWKFVFEDEIIEYDVFFEEYGVQIVLSARPWLYKDLTEYYKSKYPGSGVRGVLCVQILTYKP